MNLRRSVDRLVVDFGAIGAAHILGKKGRVFPGDRGVQTADAGIGNGYFDLIDTPDQDDALLQRVHLAEEVTIYHDQARRCLVPVFGRWWDLIVSELSGIFWQSRLPLSIPCNNIPVSISIYQGFLHSVVCAFTRDLVKLRWPYGGVGEKDPERSV